MESICTGTFAAFSRKRCRVVIFDAISACCKGAHIIFGPRFKAMLPKKIAIIFKQFSDRPSRHTQKLYTHFIRHRAIADTFYNILLTGAGGLPHLINGTRAPWEGTIYEHLGDIAYYHGLTIYIPCCIITRNLQKSAHISVFNFMSAKIAKISEGQAWERYCLGLMPRRWRKYLPKADWVGKFKA